jgi:exoribonuclease R
MPTIEGILTTKDYHHFQVIENDVIIHTFEGAKKANRCLPGDLVQVNADGSITLKDKAPPITLAGYLELDSKTTYGLNKRGHPLYLFQPLNTSYPLFMVVCSETDRRFKRIALVDTMEWDPSRELPRGALKTLLGPVGDLEAEEEALLWNACPWKGLTSGFEVEKDDCPKRTPVGDFTFNVDPDGCKDIDDCVSFEKISENEWRVTITISDVASCIKELSGVDCMASVKGQTLYKNGYAIRPMLPPALSEDACSLLPGVERQGVSLSFLWRKDEPFNEHVEWSESIIKNQKSYTYSTVPEKEANLLKAAASMLIRRPSEDPHEWIEILMKFYNYEAAKLLVKAKAGILRRHKGADLERLEAYIKIDPKLEVLANTAGEYCLVGDPNTRHVGLGEDVYCHATSPIRRYADLVNQRILKQVIRGSLEGLMVSMPVSDLNARAKACRGYERDRIFLKCLLGTGDREFDAIVLEIGVKGVLWVPAWQQRIKVKGDGLEIGKTVRFRCAMNIRQRRWKDRMVIEFI